MILDWKKWNCRSWIALIVSLFLTFGSLEQPLASTGILVRESTSARTIKILLVGNSYTAYNNLSDLLQGICESKGKKVRVTSVTKGGACLKEFATKTTVVGKKLHSLLKNQRWDYVILQDRHYYPLTNIYDMERAVQSLIPYIKNAGAQPALYMTWAPAKGHKDYKEYKNLVSGREEYQKKIASVYKKIADKTDAALIPVGLAFQNAMKQNDCPALIRSDKSHPTKYGSYLAACTMYASIFDESPVGAYTAGLDRSWARLLQRVSWRTIL